jgi:SRSO17 transposase
VGRKEENAGARFEAYVRKLSEAIGHADREESLHADLKGLLLSGERKSVEPMAARVDPRHVSARHQSMHHFVSSAPWDERDVLRIARDNALAQLELRHVNGRGDR